MLFFNEDWIHFLWSRYERNMPVNEDTLKDFIYQYKDTQITDFCLNVNGTVSSAKSKIFETFVDKYHSTEENGILTDYKNTYAKVAYEIIEEQGLDQYKIWIDTLREINIRPWISIRINDCHDNYLEKEIRKSSYVEKHSNWWRVQHREANEYFDKCFDYSIEAVQSRMIAYIQEMLQNYAPDGLELDFTREMSLVKIGYEYDSFDLITGFIKKVYELVQSEKKKCGHDIKIGVLIGANLSAAFNQGFDVKRWCDDGLIDFVTILPRWETINTAMDIGLWKRLIPENVGLGTGLQLLVKAAANSKAKMVLVDHDFGQAVANFSLGADFIYLYNHFDISTSDTDDFMIENSLRKPENINEILRNIGKLETAINKKRRHILTYDDYIAPWETKSPRLPLELNNIHQQIRIAVGKVLKGSKAELVLGFEKAIEAEKLNVYINSVSVTYKCYGGRYDKEDYSYTFSIPDDIIKSYAVIEISYKGSATLNFAEIVIDALE